MTPCRLTFPENVPLLMPAFLHPVFVPIATGSGAPMLAVCSGLTPHTARDRPAESFSPRVGGTGSLPMRLDGA